MNIRISKRDIDRLKIRALEEGKEYFNSGTCKESRGFPCHYSKDQK